MTLNAVDEVLFKKELPPPLVFGDIKPLLLLIDDNVRILNGLKLHLEKKYRLRMCTGGQEGLEQLDEDVRAVILDIKMPGKNGFEVYEELKATFPNLPVIFYSAYQNVLEEAELNRKYQPFNYFNKSGNVKELLDCIERAVHYYEKLLRFSDLERRMQSIGTKK